ncbi:AAA family ATPase [Xanthobacter sediminis]
MIMGCNERRIWRRIQRAAVGWRSAPPIDPNEVPWRRSTDESRPPSSDVLLAVLFARLLDEHPWLAGEAARTAVIVTLKVRDEAMAEAMKPIVDQVLGGTYPKTLRRGRDRGTDIRHVTVLIERTRSDRHDQRELTKAAGAAIAGGSTVVALWYQDDRSLPHEIRQISIAALVFPEVDARLLQRFGRMICGGPCFLSITDRGAESLTLNEIMAAFAFGLPAAECVRRVSAFLAAKVPVESKSSLSLADLHGLGAAKDWGEQLADDLAAYRDGRLPWAAVDRGLLLGGPPGVGKTTYAKALATTCGVALISTSVARWYAAPHLGETLTQIRADFAKAAQSKPAILFIDEIDGVGDRATMDPRHKDYFTQIVNALLECLDGADGREGVVVVGACNSPQQVDPALRRPGRLDREIHIPRPDAAALEQIYRFHLGSDLLDVDLQPLAAVSVGATGADVELWVRTARRLARRAGRAVWLDDLVAQVRGPVSHLPEPVLRRVCIHEAGHAVAALALGLSEHVTVTIGARGTGLGATFFERSAIQLDTREAAPDLARYTLAGRAAEDVLLGSISSGSGGASSSDLAQATTIVASLECSFGLGAEGDLTWFGYPQTAAGFLRQPRIARVVQRTLRELYAQVRELIEDRRAGVQRIAEVLQVRFHLSGSDLVALLGEGTRPAHSVAPTADAVGSAASL